MIKLKRKKSRKLDLSGKNFDVFPPEVFYDKKITSLDLSNNHIREIPANIGELTDLRYLYLRNNDITQLHSGILKAKSLRCVYLYDNPMKTIPNFIKEKATFSVFTDNDAYRFYPEVTIEGNNGKLQKEIGQEVDGITTHETEFGGSNKVPTVEDLTFERHCERKGARLNTCVLFVDIRDSVQKNKDHRAQTLAKMYSSFVYGVLRIAKHYSGHVRNIIGDRVMVVFDEEDSCDNAVECAGSIMYFCKNKMGKTLPNDTFKCGIGIHYGEMNVIKVGLVTHSSENNDYKNLVWIGEPANLASRLTDMAGKDGLPSVTISKVVYQRLKNTSKRHFASLDKKRFKDIEFDIYGCNLIIK